MTSVAHFSFREHWRVLKRGRPGRRFQDCYERSRAHQQECGPGQRIVLFVAATIAFLIGVVLSVIPGPAIPFFFIAGGLLATESLPIARFMDWTEVKVRAVFAWAKRGWRRLPRYGRAILLLMLACGLASAAYMSYRIFLR